MEGPIGSRTDWGRRFLLAAVCGQARSAATRHEASIRVRCNSQRLVQRRGLCAKTASNRPQSARSLASAATSFGWRHVGGRAGVVVTPADPALARANLARALVLAGAAEQALVDGEQPGDGDGRADTERVDRPPDQDHCCRAGSPSKTSKPSSPAPVSTASGPNRPSRIGGGEHARLLIRPAR